jgi:L-ascorbate metabolism protein UlaG (beta-lactamase superfamily)
MEPLVARWYAWPHLLSPASFALNMEYRYLPLLQSYLNNPAIHHAAAQDQSLFCGPFINVEAELREQISTLLTNSIENNQRGSALAKSIRRLEHDIIEFGDGDCLDRFYDELPDNLRGRIELGYDCHGRPNMRLFEPMLYLDSLTRDFQQISLTQIADEERSFFLNTPRLRSPDRLDLDLAFDHPVVEEIGALRTYGRKLGDIALRARLGKADLALFDSMLTDEAPVRNTPNFSGSGIRIRYFGHACVLVQTAFTSVLFDPVVPWQLDADMAALAFDDLPDRIDYVVLTHNHQDHVSIETLLQLRGRIGEIVVPRNNCLSTADPSLKLLLESLGFLSVIEAGPLSELKLADGVMITLPFLGEHADLDIQAKHGIFLEMCGRRLLFLADSKCVDRHLYRNLAAKIGNVDMLFIGMECDGAPLSWLYGPHLPQPPRRRHDNARRLSGSDCERAWAVVQEIGCQQVFIYAMGQEPWLRHLLGLAYTADSPQIVESNAFMQRLQVEDIPVQRLKGCQEFYLAAAGQDLSFLKHTV